MKTISIVKKDFNSVLITVDGVSSKLTVMSFNTYAGVGDVCCLCISSANKKYELNLDPSVDTITIGETLFEGTGAELAAALDTHMEQDLSVSEVVIYKRKTILTNDQIKELPTTFVELVPAPGAGKSLVFHTLYLTNNTSGGIYTNVSAPEFSITYGENEASAGSGISQAGSFLGNTDKYALFAPAQVFINGANYSESVGAFLSSAFENKGFCLSGYNDTSDNYTGGHADNTFEVTVFYSIVDL